MASAHCYVRFDPTPSILKAWSKELHLPRHPDALSLEDLYARALPLFHSVRQTLLSSRNRASEVRAQPGELWAIQLPVLRQDALSPVTPTAPRIFAVPISLASLVERRAIWQEMFHDQMIYRAIMDEEIGLMVHASADPVLEDVFYLLQLLLPGCLVLVKEVFDREAFNTRESRPFPSVKWMERMKTPLGGIFGQEYWDVLVRRARDVSLLEFLD